MRIYLIGFMGAGKSYLGRALAEQLDVGFLDLDDVIQNLTGMTISAYFEKNGEQQFRILEAKCLRDTISMDAQVIATGGGAPCFHNNMDWMNEHGITVFLDADPALLIDRLRQEATKRPLISSLTTEELELFISKKLEERLPFYGQSQLQFEVPESGLRGIDGLAKYLNRFFFKKIFGDTHVSTIQSHLNNDKK